LPTVSKPLTITVQQVRLWGLLAASTRAQPFDSINNNQKNHPSQQQNKVRWIYSNKTYFYRYAIKFGYLSRFS